MGTDIERRIEDASPEQLTAANALEVSAAWEADALAAIERVTDPAEAERLIGLVKSADDALRTMKLGKENTRSWAVVQLRAERKWGILLGPSPGHGPGRGKNVSGTNVISGADRVARNEARKVAAVSDRAFETYITTTQDPVPTRTGLKRAASPPKPRTNARKEEEAMPQDRKRREHIALDARVRLLRDQGKTREQIAAALGSTRAKVWDALNRLEGEERGRAAKKKKTKPWNEKSVTQQLREIKEAAGKSEFEQYMDIVRTAEVVIRLSTHLQGLNPADWYAKDEDPDWVLWMTELADSVTTLGVWSKRAETALNSWLEEGGIDAKIRKLRSYTGSTPEETKIFHDKADWLERNKQLVLAGKGGE